MQTNTIFSCKDATFRFLLMLWLDNMSGHPNPSCIIQPSPQLTIQN